MHRAARLGLPVVALAAGLPPLLAGMVATTSPEVLVGPRDDTVRTVLVDTPPPPLTDHQAALDGAHPATDPAPQLLGQAVDSTARAAGRDRSRGLPVRVSGTALPARVLLAYRNAAADLRQSDPACHLPWSLLAGIGQVESGQAYGGAVDRQGRTLTPILGPVLDGSGGFAAIPDTDHGRWDGNTTWDRAVGPMQFIPSSWAVWGRDGDGNGTADPSDIDDAALAAGSYLCAGGGDLRNVKDERSAVFSYNHSWDYVALVLAWADAYATGTPVQYGSVGGGRGASQGGGRSGGPGADGGGTLVALGPPATAPTAPTASTAPSAPAAGGTPVGGPASAAPLVEPSPSTAAQTAAAGTPTSPPATDRPTTAAPSPTDSPTATATGCPTPTDSPSPTATPTDTPSPTGTATAGGTPTPTDSASPTPTSSGPGC